MTFTNVLDRLMLRMILYAYKRPGTLNRTLLVLILFICISMVLDPRGSATIDNRDSLYHGHPPGGVSILWRKKYDRFITPIKFEVDWLTGIMFNQDGKKYAALSVYMP